MQVTRATFADLIRADPSFGRSLPRTRESGRLFSFRIGTAEPRSRKFYNALRNYFLCLTGLICARVLNSESSLSNFTNIFNPIGGASMTLEMFISIENTFLANCECSCPKTTFRFVIEDPRICTSHSNGYSGACPACYAACNAGFPLYVRYSTISIVIFTIIHVHILLMFSIIRFPLTSLLIGGD
ncbi:hypothetical protein PUN28_001838 [Cardiocondyla obscurior]|uniref:Kazal-like domain-containing protein n=1 Tax=Cardiocondyla obscurior TaxID=286306 RepID=A0AAW2GRH9_9HYME